MNLPRPKSILWFERFFFLSLGLELINEYVTLEMWLGDFGLDLSSEGVGTSIYILLWVLMAGIYSAIWYFLAIRARPWARWAQIILAGLGVIILLFEIGAALTAAFEDVRLLEVVWENLVWPETLTVLYVAAIAANVVATYFLFRKDAIKWVEHKQVSIDTVFD